MTNEKPLKTQALILRSSLLKMLRILHHIKLITPKQRAHIVTHTNAPWLAHYVDAISNMPHPRKQPHP